MKNRNHSSRVLIILSVIIGCCFSALANLATNGDFESTTGWSFGNDAGRVDWAYESGAYGAAFYGWINGGNGYFEQHVDCDTNATYYFRIRGLREWNFDTGSVDMRLRFFDNATSWNSQGAYDNANVNLSSSTSWTTYEISADVPAGSGIVQMRCDFSGSSDTGGSQAFKWDNATLYDRRKNYTSTEIIDEFSYDPDYENGIDSKDRGHGFSQNWSWLWGTLDIDDGSFGSFDGYPKPYGNKLRIAGTGGGAYRQFTAKTTGAIYASACFNYSNESTGNWAGISLMSNDVERIFFGGSSGSGTKMKLSIDSFGGTSITNSNYNLNGGIGSDYILFCKYDFTTHMFYTKAYYKTFSIPIYEPTAWDVSVDLSSNPDRLSYINGIRLAAGVTSPDNVYFDEVRVADTWHELLNQEKPVERGTMLIYN